MNTETNCTSGVPALGVSLPLFPYRRTLPILEGHKVSGGCGFFFLPFLNQLGKKVFPYILLSDEIGEQQEVAVSSHFTSAAQEAGGTYTMLW